LHPLLDGAHEDENVSAAGWPQSSTCDKQQKIPAGPDSPAQYCEPGVAQMLFPIRQVPPASSHVGPPS
jgi:hypothetical protein